MEAIGFLLAILDMPKSYSGSEPQIQHMDPCADQTTMKLQEKTKKDF